MPCIYASSLNYEIFCLDKVVLNDQLGGSYDPGVAMSHCINACDFHELMIGYLLVVGSLFIGILTE